MGTLLISTNSSISNFVSLTTFLLFAFQVLLLVTIWHCLIIYISKYFACQSYVRHWKNWLCTLAEARRFRSGGLARYTHTSIFTKLRGQANPRAPLFRRPTENCNSPRGLCAARAAHAVETAALQNRLSDTGACGASTNENAIIIQAYVCISRLVVTCTLFLTNCSTFR